MEEARANSMRIHFGPEKREPTDHEIFNFMKVKMNLKSASLLSMYKEPKEQCIYVKFKSEELLKQALQRLPTGMDFDYDKYESTRVTFSAASSIFKYVRLFSLPPEIADGEIAIVLAKYGTIQRMVRETYGSETGFPIWTKVRGVHMEIKQDIPATIHVRNYQARVFYDGLQNKCFVCGSAEHIKVNCPKRTEQRDQQKESRGGSSYSDVVARPARWTGKSGVSKKAESTSNGGEENSGGQGESSNKMTNLNKLLKKPIVLQNPIVPSAPNVSSDTNKPSELRPKQGDEEATSSAAASSTVAASAAVDSDSSQMIVEQEDNSTPNKTKTASEEESEFRVVESKRRKQAVRSQSSDTKVKASEQGTSSIPKLNLSLEQSKLILTRGREKERKSGGNRSRSRSNQGGKSSGKPNTQS